MAQAIAEREKTVPLKEVSKLANVFSNDDFMKRLQQAVPKQLSPNRMLRSLVGSVQRSPDLLKCGLLDVVGKMLVCASAGLETDTPLGHAHLIPFRKRTYNRETRKYEEGFICQVIFGYHGLLDLSYRTGMLGTVNSRCVWKSEYEKGAFSFEFGTQRHLRHRPLGGTHDLSPEAQAAGKADWPMFVYAHATLKDGFADPFEVMPWSDVEDIRNRAQAYQAAKRALDKGQEAQDKYVPSTWTEAPWVRHVRAMANKTVFRQLSNWLPRTIEMAAVTAIEEAQERGAMDFSPVIDGTVFRDDGMPDYLGAANELSSDVRSEGFGLRDGQEDDPGPDTTATTNSMAKPATATKARTVTDPPKTETGAPSAGTPAGKPAAESRQAASTSGGAGAAPADTLKMTVATQGGGGAGPASNVTTPPPEPFQHWASDEFGEPIEEHQGEPLDSPMAFAAWFESAAAKTSNPNGLREQNMDAIGDAGADPVAAQRISDALKDAETRLAKPAPTEEKTAEPTDQEKFLHEAGGGAPTGLQPIPVPTTPKGVIHRPNYRAAMKAAMAEIVTLAELAEFEVVNRAHTGEAEAALWTGIDADISARRQVLTPAPAKRDTDSAWAESAVGEIKAMKTRPEITAWGGGTAPKTVMARLKEQRPELFKLVSDAVDLRWKELEPT